MESRDWHFLLLFVEGLLISLLLLVAAVALLLSFVANEIATLLVVLLTGVSALSAT
jgi:hypothetical protein